MKLILILLLFSIIFITSEAMMMPPTISCDFKRENSLYGCKIQSIQYFHKSFRTIIQIENVQSGEIVKFLRSDGVKLSAFPIFTEIFGDLEDVDVKNADLKEISSDDLKQFGVKLRILDLGHNEIEILDKNLFIHSQSKFGENFT